MLRVKNIVQAPVRGETLDNTTVFSIVYLSRKNPDQYKHTAPLVPKSKPQVYRQKSADTKMQKFNKSSDSRNPAGEKGPNARPKALILWRVLKENGLSKIL